MSTDGLALPSFADFVLATKAHKITPSTEILNECARRTYLLAMMLKGRGNEEVVQAGSKIIDHIQLKKMNNAGFYRPNQNLQPRGVDTLTPISCPWRFHQGNYGWSEEIIKLNMSNGGDPADIYTRLKTSWEQACQLDIWDSMEDALYATPDTNEMEADGGLVPYSIPTFITDDGLAPAGFTTVEGINPTNESRWRNQTDSYTVADKAGTLYASFDRMWRKLSWKRIKGFNAGVGSPATKNDKLIILSNGEGRDLYTSLNRDANDRLRKANDAGYGDDPTYNDIPVEYIEQLDSIFTAGSPKFDWLNLDYIFPVYHSDKFMDETPPIRGSINQPFSFALYKNTYYNLMCRSRRRLGRVVGV
jgi:hypothetical protein